MAIQCRIREIYLILNYVKDFHYTFFVAKVFRLYKRE